jgi:septal ring factor EnvC (AmiA/AmiB activator)
MDNNQLNSQETPDSEEFAGDTAIQKAGQSTHFKRTLVPLDEYAARQGISSDIVEKQGQLGVVQIRKFKGQKFVVDVPADQLSEFENDNAEESGAKPIKPRSTNAFKLVTAGLVALSITVVVTVFWLYMDAKTKLDDLRAENASIQSIYENLTTSNENAKALQEELAGSKAELALIQNRIALSKTELERIQTDLNKARRNLDTVQSELSGVQGQISLSKVEIESIQNGLNQSRSDLDGLHRQNAEPNAATP